MSENSSSGPTGPIEYKGEGRSLVDVGITGPGINPVSSSVVSQSQKKITSIKNNYAIEKTFGFRLKFKHKDDLEKFSEDLIGLKSKYETVDQFKIVDWVRFWFSIGSLILGLIIFVAEMKLKSPNIYFASIGMSLFGFSAPAFGASYFIHFPGDRDWTYGFYYFVRYFPMIIVATILFVLFVNQYSNSANQNVLQIFTLVGSAVIGANADSIEKRFNNILDALIKRIGGN